MASRPWEELKGQIYLGSEAFIEKHAAANNGVKETPQVQLRAARAVAEADIRKKREESDSRAYDHGCDLMRSARIWAFAMTR
jgi:hypothetical protein